MTPIPAVIAGISWKHWLRAGLLTAGFTLFIAVGVLVTLVYPPAAILFLAPVAAAIAAYAPAMRAAPKPIVMALIYAGVLLLPLWPVYLHLKLGPLPILTPPRLLLYAVSAFWLYDMVASRMRRAQLASAFKRGGRIAVPVAALFLLGLLSLPLAQGKAIAAPEFFRQVTIWLIPFLAVATYVRRARELKAIVLLLTIAAGASGAGAVAEYASGKLLANILSPFISDGGEWLRVAQAEKIRDGVFRAQFTHTHPLSLGEFLALMAPVAFALAILEKKLGRKLCWGLCLALIFGGAAATASRGALLAIAFALAVSGAFCAFRLMRTAGAWRFKPAAGLLASLALLASPVLAIGAWQVIAGEPGQSTARSSQGRIDQIEQAWPKIVKRPIGGYGSGRAARVLGFWGTTLTVDNYYLSLALDLGLPGPVTLAVVFLGMGVLAGRNSRCGRAMSGVHVGLAGAAGALGSSSLPPALLAM